MQCILYFSRLFNPRPVTAETLSDLRPVDLASVEGFHIRGLFFRKVFKTVSPHREAGVVADDHDPRCVLIVATDHRLEVGDVISHAPVPRVMHNPLVFFSPKRDPHAHGQTGAQRSPYGNVAPPGSLELDHAASPAERLARVGGEYVARTEELRDLLHDALGPHGNRVRAHHRFHDGLECLDRLGDLLEAGLFGRGLRHAVPPEHAEHLLQRNLRVADERHIGLVIAPDGDRVDIEVDDLRRPGSGRRQILGHVGAGAGRNEKDEIGPAHEFVGVLAAIAADDADVERVIFGEASLRARIDGDGDREELGEFPQFAVGSGEVDAGAAHHHGPLGLGK